MTVELEDPFVWPDELEDLSEWNKKEKEKEEEEGAQAQKKMRPTGDAVVEEERRERMREQAKALLEGKERWRPPQDVRATVGSVGNRWAYEKRS